MEEVNRIVKIISVVLLVLLTLTISGKGFSLLFLTLKFIKEKKYPIKAFLFILAGHYWIHRNMSDIQSYYDHCSELKKLGIQI